MKHEIKGVMPALVTPLNPDGLTLNVSALRKLISYQKHIGADGFTLRVQRAKGLFFL